MKTFELFCGRFQPLHLGHTKVIRAMTHPIIVIVRGSKTCQNKNNPFSEEYQIELLRKLFPDIEYSVSPNGFLPGILGFLKKQGKNISIVYCGSDRIKSYKNTICIANSTMSEQERYNIIFRETPRITSGAEIRESIKNNDLEFFKENIPEELWSEFDKMKSILLKV